MPLSRRALEALDALPPRLDTPLVFPAPRGGLVCINNWRRREWAPAVEAAGIARPARPYDTRATFVSDALRAGVPVFTVAKIAGTSVRMIERSYGRLLDVDKPTSPGAWTRSTTTASVPRTTVRRRVCRLCAARLSLQPAP